MATSQDAYTTGAAQEDYLRRRQVPRQDSSNGSLKRSYNEADDKKTRKVNKPFMLSNIISMTDRISCSSCKLRLRFYKHWINGNFS